MIAEAGNKLIHEYPALVARLAVATKITPATEFATALLPVVLVILSNHNIIDGPTPEEVLAQFQPPTQPGT